MRSERQRFPGRISVNGYEKMINPGTVSVIIPAFNEEDRIGATVDAVLAMKVADEIIVVDDGSTDNTARIAARRGARIVRMMKNSGKGAAMNEGLTAALGEVLVFLDADLGETAAQALPIIRAAVSGEADIAIGAFSSRSSGGFGFVLKFARWGIRATCGQKCVAPLSGQRAIRREALEAIYPLRRDFGVETAMIIDAVRAGLRVREIPVDMAHRALGRTLRGFLHRAHQGAGIFRAVARAFIRYKLPNPHRLLKLKKGKTEHDNGKN